MFPAIPPGGFRKKLQIAKPAPPPKQKLQFKLGPMLSAIFTFVREFEHWRVVGFCLIPFIVIALGLVAARAAKRHQEANPTEVRPTQPQVEAGTWDKMEELTRADQQMPAYVQAVRTAKARVDLAVRTRDALHNTYRGQNLDTASFQLVMARYEAADKEVNNSQQSLNATRQLFNQAYTKYQGLGGKVDYQSQLPP